MSVHLYADSQAAYMSFSACQGLDDDMRGAIPIQRLCPPAENSA